MRQIRVENVKKTVKVLLGIAAQSASFACAGSGSIPTQTQGLQANPSSLTFANPQSPAQQLTLSGGAPQHSDSAISPSQECFSIKNSTQAGLSVTYTVAPQAAAMNACYMGMIAAGPPLLVPIAVGVQMQPNTSTTYVFQTGDSAPTLQSSDPAVATVPASATVVAANGTLPARGTFTIKAGATGTAVINVYQNGTNAPATYSIPVLVTSAPAPTPTPVPTSTPTAGPTSSPTPSPTSTPTSSPTTAPTPSPTPSPTAAPTNPPTSSFTLLSSGSQQTFSLAGSPVAAQIAFYGAVTITGAASESVGYSEVAGIPSNGCSVSGTIVDAISLTFPTAFTFAPNGSFGPGTGLLDTLFTPSIAGTYYGEIFQAGSCTTPFDAASQAYLVSPPSNYEYPGGGNTSIPAGTYILELYH